MFSRQPRKNSRGEGIWRVSKSAGPSDQQASPHYLHHYGAEYLRGRFRRRIRHKLTLRMTHGQHRARRRPDDAFSDAAKQHVAERTAPVRTEHDQIYAPSRGVPHYLPNTASQPVLRRPRARRTRPARSRSNDFCLRLPVREHVANGSGEGVGRPRHRIRVLHDVEEVQSGAKCIRERKSGTSRLRRSTR